MANEQGSLGVRKLSTPQWVSRCHLNQRGSHYKSNILRVEQQPENEVKTLAQEFVDLTGSTGSNSSARKTKVLRRYRGQCTFLSTDLMPSTVQKSRMVRSHTC